MNNNLGLPITPINSENIFYIDNKNIHNNACTYFAIPKHPLRISVFIVLRYDEDFEEKR